jgi:hypothetical protein
MKRKIRNLYDAVIKTKIGEDQFTNFLIYIIQLYPTNILNEIFKKFNLCNPLENSQINCYVQYKLVSSIPDAVIKTSDNNYIVIETKIVENTLKADQIERHIKGSILEFGINNFSILIISPDRNLPNNISILNKEFNKIKIYFLSWKSLIAILTKIHDNFDNSDESRMINEFIQFTNNFKLLDHAIMKIEDIESFNKNYSFIKLREAQAANLYNIEIDELAKYIISNSNKKLKIEIDDKLSTLPLLYRAIKISKWYISKSAVFIIIDIEINKIHVLLTCYQSKHEKMKFLRMSYEKFESLIVKHKEIEIFSWKEGDNISLYNEGYFERLGNISPKNAIKNNDEYLYFGHSYPLNDYINNEEIMKNEISGNINKLILELQVI